MRSASALVFLTSLAACGDSATTPPGPPADSGAADSPAVDASADDAGTFAKSGGVYVSAYSYPVGSKTFSGGSLSASFVDATGAAASPVCQTTTAGACKLSLCPQPVLSDAAAPVQLTAGAITVDGTTGGPSTLTPSGADYAPVSSSTSLFLGGESLTASAPGDAQGAPAFSRTVKAPSYVFVSEPLFPGTGPMSIDRTKDLPVVWTAGTEGDTAVTLSGQAGGQTFLLQCTVPATAGKLTVPASALGKLPQVTATGLAVVSVSTLAIDRRRAGDWSLYLYVSAQGARPGGVASAGLLLP